MTGSRAARILKHASDVLGRSEAYILAAMGMDESQRRRWRSKEAGSVQPRTEVALLRLERRVQRVLAQRGEDK